MAHSEPWQVFAESGEPISGRSAQREEFATDRLLIMAASQIWVWRKAGSAFELLLQKRASNKSSWPGYWDISVTGHVDAGESFMRSAVREAQEEIGLVINSDRLQFIFSLRTPLDKQEIDHVYLYELKDEDDVEFSFVDGEVEQLAWVAIDKFEEMIKDPERHKLVPQGNEYFALLMKLLRRSTVDA